MKLRAKTLAAFVAGMVCQMILSRPLIHREPHACAPGAPVAEAQPLPSVPDSMAAEKGLPRPRSRPQPSRDLSEAVQDSDNEGVGVPDERACPLNATAFRDSAPNEDRFSCRCSAEATENGSVWGTDTYTTDSSICRAAKHAGIWRNEGDEVTVYLQPGRPKYEGSDNNGIHSEDYGSWENSFSFLP